MYTRAEAAARLRSDIFDVCVIGGGATGAGCALDAQLRSLNTAVLDGGDFGSGTSSASSKLAHGGVRYLEQIFTEGDVGQFRVVQRDLHERRTILRNAPHLAHPLRFLVPCYSRRELAYYRIGLKIYDWISGPGMLFASSYLPLPESLAHIPNLNREELIGAVAYADGQFDDSRYNLALITTLASCGGTALNYARVVGFEKNRSGKLIAARVVDVNSGREFAVRARVFVNAAGPGSDEVRALAKPGMEPRLRLSKGVHIVLPLEVLGGTDALLIPKTDDERVIFAMPWLGRLVVGATDDEVPHGAEIIVEHAEVEYLLRHLNRYLNQSTSVADVVSCFSGVRPLVRAGASRHTKKLLRTHEVQVDREAGLVNIRGGKWTTYRVMARDTIDAVQQYLGTSITRCETADQRLTGADGYSDTYASGLIAYGISFETANHLAQKFGSCAKKVLALGTDETALLAPLAQGCAPIRAEVVYAARNEMATTLEDVLARRIGLQYFGWRAAIAAAPATGMLLARELGWSESERIAATEQYVSNLKRQMQTARMGAVTA